MSLLRYLSRRNRRGLPDWLFNERISPIASEVDQEWRRIAAQPAGEDDGMSRLAGAMMMLRAERPRRPLLAQANTRALRWVDRTLRSTRTAAALRAVSPQLPWRVRLLLPVQRLAVPVVCGVVMLICRTGLLNVLENACRLGGRLARLHVDRHIGPMV